MHLKRHLFAGMIVFTLALLAVSSARAQSAATLQGTVTDPSGAVIAGAQIAATEMHTGSKRATVSDAAGQYALPSLQPGTYNLVVSAQGMQTKTLENIILSIDSTQQINVSLGLTAMNQTVDVSGTAQQVNSSTMTVGQVIDQKTVQEVPLNGRHFLDLSMLIPGSVTAPPGGLLTTPNVGLGASSFLTAGNREDTVNFMINGINLNDMIQNTITFQPSINTVSEFKVDNSSLSAEYGRNSGAVVTVATRSGTNEFHGEAFDYIRNNAVDARNFFQPTSVPMSPLHRNQPGGALGGPVWIPHLYDGKNKTFFFISYEGLYQSLGAPINSGVLTNAQRAAVTNPVILSLLPLIPVANDPTGSRFVGSTASNVFVKQITGDFHQNLGINDQLHLYYAWQQDARIEPTSSTTIPGFGDHRDAHRHVGTIGETHEFSSNLVNEARLGFNRRAIGFDANFTADPASYGINNGVTTPIGLPSISVTSLNLEFGGPPSFPQGAYDTTTVFSDNLSWLHGKHNFNFGGEYRWFINDNLSNDTSTFIFPTAAAFMSDSATSFSITPGPVKSRIFVNAVGAYGQDIYKINQRLSLQLGLRFDWYGTPTESQNRFVDFNPATDSLQRANGDVYNQSYNLGPRAGFILDPLGTGRTIVRAGFSMQADEPETGVVTGLTTNPPFSTPVSFNGPVSLADAITVAAASPTLAPAYTPHDLKSAYVESYNLNLQQQLPWGLVSQFGYIGSHGVHLQLTDNVNQYTSYANFLNKVRPFQALSPTSEYDPSKGLGNIAEIAHIGMSKYSALWSTITMQLHNGLQFNSSYTWSRSMDDNSYSSQGVTLQNSYDPANNYGPSDFDVRSRIVFSSIYSLPFKNNALVSGWQLSTIAQIQTGNPISVVTNSALNGTVGTVRPDVSGNVRTSMTVTPGGVVQYIPQSICVTPTAGCTFSSDGNHFGDSPRNLVYGPGFEDVDFSIAKRTSFFKRYAIEIKMDAFNILNHPNFGAPSNEFVVTQPTTPGGPITVTAGNFGQISTTRFPSGDVGSSRQLQLSGKFIF
jgi:hypothetical protein